MRLNNSFSNKLSNDCSWISYLNIKIFLSEGEIYNLFYTKFPIFFYFDLIFFQLKWDILKSDKNMCTLKI